MNEWIVNIYSTYCKQLSICYFSHAHNYQGPSVFSAHPWHALWVAEICSELTVEHLYRKFCHLSSLPPREGVCTVWRTVRSLSPHPQLWSHPIRFPLPTKVLPTSYLPDLLFNTAARIPRASTLCQEVVSTWEIHCQKRWGEVNPLHSEVHMGVVAAHS